MKRFEISSKADKDGMRNFKIVLHTIFPDSCVDEENQVGTEYQTNGITWIEEYCEKALPSMIGKSVRVEFIDKERTEIAGHGETGIAPDGTPTYEDAVVVGTFNKVYIDDVEGDDGEPIRAAIGEGTIDAQCYHNFCTKLDEDIANDILPYGSVEIMHDKDHEGIGYLYGYKELGRIPTEFVYSGYALLGVMPADYNARLLELNNQHKEELHMDKAEMKAFATEVASEISNQQAQIDACKADCEAKIAEANAATEAVVTEKNEIQATVDELKAALEKVQAEYKALNEKYDALYEERCALEKALGEAKAKERLAELDAAIEPFSEQEQAYAEAEIEAYKADPINSEVNSVISKIYEGIGKSAKEKEDEDAKKAETNSANTDFDIFGAVEDTDVEQGADFDMYA